MSQKPYEKTVFSWPDYTYAVEKILKEKKIITSRVWGIRPKVNILEKVNFRENSERLSSGFVCGFFDHFYTVFFRILANGK